MKNYYYLNILILFLYSLNVNAQGTETFESLGENVTTFTNNGYTFTTSPLFDTQLLNAAGAGNSNYFLDNLDNIGTNKTYAITITGGATLFTMKTMEVYVSSSNTGAQPTDDGSMTFTGKVGTTTIFTYTKSSGFPTTLVDPANGYFKLNFAALPGVGDVSSMNIDRLEISHAGAFQYVSVDNFQFGAEVLNTDPPVVNSITLNGTPPTTATSISYTVIFNENSNNVSTDDFIIDAVGTSGNIASVTGSGTTYTVTINNVSGEGTISLDLKASTNIADDLGNSPPPAFTNGTAHTVSRCFIETFEGVSAGSTSFSSNSVNFTTTTNFSIEFLNNAGAADSDHFLSNKNDQGTGKKYSVKTSGGELFTVDDMEMYLSSITDGTTPTNDGSLIVRGKLTGSTLFTITKNSGFPTTHTGADNGFFILDFATSGSSDYSLTNIDELEIELSGAFRYLGLDNFDHCEASSAASPPIVQNIELVGNPQSNVTTVDYQVVFNEVAVNVTTDDFLVTTTGTVTGVINSISGTGNTYTVNINGISGEGTIRLDLKSSTDIADIDGNTPPDPYIAGEVHIVTNCKVETFETLTNDSFSWTTGFIPFTTGTSNFKVRQFDNAGAGGSDRFLDNTTDQGTGKTYTISITNSDIVNMGSMEIYLSSIANGDTPTNDGTLTVKGKLDNVEQFSVTKSTGFPTSLGSTQGFFVWNFSSEGGTDYSSTDIDEIEVTLGSAFQYIVIDNFKYCEFAYDCSNNRLYVDTNATAGNNGSDWTNAYTNLQSALVHTQYCSNINEIWVAKGTYKPGTLETDSFIIPENITLLGGFNGTETVASERNWVANPTILSGDLNNDTMPSTGDSHSIMTITKSNITVNGFIFENSFADAASTLADRSGAAVFISNATTPSNIQFTNTIFRNNHAVGTGTNGVGGAIISYGNNHSYTNCLFYNNHASSSGGALSPQSGNTLKITNCTFAKNNATTEGGALHFFNVNTEIVNSVFAENTASTRNPDINNHLGNGINLSYSALNQASLTAGAGSGTVTIGGNNVNTTNPLFTNAAANDFSLQSSSPLVDAGLNTANTQTKDLAGNTRIMNSTIDIGAYENLCAGLGTTTLYVNAAATGANNGTSWNDAFTDLQATLNIATTCTSITQIWVAKGTYKPGTSPTDSFVIPEGITLLGGFNGTETVASERNWVANPTILSGDLNNDTMPSTGDSHSIMTITKSNITVNGFIFENSFADAASTLADRSGAAVFISNATTPSNIQFTNTIFRNNHAVGTGTNGVGGAIISYGNNHSYTNCLFYNNHASSSGGALSPQSGNTLKITNCTFAKNNATTEGGALHFFNVNTEIVNSVFAENTASTRNPDINNHLGNGINLSYSVLDQAFPVAGAGSGTVTIGTNNVNATNPLFTNAAANDFSLQLTSPLVDAGNNTANTQTKDLAGNTRIINSTIDVGAYEKNPCAGLGSIIYVNAAATGVNNGTSWNDAFTSLEQALALQDCGFTGEIRVASGTYKPSAARLCTTCTASPRENYFLIKDNIQLKGSYTAGTTTQNYNNPTILSGDINGNDVISGSGPTLSITNNAENVYNVVITTGLNSTALIDGLTITGGNSNRSGTPSGNRTVNGQTIFQSNGGGMYNRSSSPSITNTTFSGNSANEGGGMYNRSSSPSLSNTTFSGNSASSDGGGMSNDSSSPSLTNTTFSGNSAGFSGGGMYNISSSTPTLYNTVLYDNGIDIVDISSSSINTTSTHNYSQTFFAHAGFTELTADPFTHSADPDGADNLFGTPDDGLFPAIGSPLINTGDDSKNTQTTDLAGQARKVGLIDIGAYEYDTAITTWLGTTSSSWNTATNWSGGIPSATTSVVLKASTPNEPNVTTTAMAAKDVAIENGVTLTIDAGGSLTMEGNLIQNGTFTINSDATSNGSFILKGMHSGAETASYTRYVTTSAISTQGWHLISSPVDGKNIDDFYGDVVSNGTKRAIAPYVNTNGVNLKWAYYLSTETFPGFFTNGKGYTIKKATAGTLAFDGFLNTDDVSIEVTATGDQFNVIGNPYTSYINSGTFLDNVPVARLTEKTIWLWDAAANGGAGEYITKNSATAYKIAPGQGFFVKAALTGNVTFLENTQTHLGGNTFLKGENRPEIKLSITDGTHIKSTEIFYIEGKTTGFDNGYDSSMFSGVSNPFVIYTQLVANNEGKNLAIQTLPNSNYEKMIIPVGVNAEAGKEITFTTETLNLPTDIKLFLEDRATNTFTRLEEANSIYKVTVATALNGTGRFYIHTLRSGALTVKDVALENVSIYKTNATTIRITGLQEGKANVKLFNLLGKQVLNTSFDTKGKSIKEISLPKLAAGVYVVKLQTDKGKLNKKLILE